MKNKTNKGSLPGKVAKWVFLTVFLGQSLGFSSSLSAQTVIGPGTTFKVAAGTTMMSAENLVIKNGALLGNSGTLVLKKGLTNEYTIPNSLGSGMAEFSGTTNQAILGQNILQDMKVANSAGITIGGNTVVNGALNFVNGRIVLGTYHLQMGPLASITGSVSATAMVVATGTGELRKAFSTGFTGIFIWPVGDATNTVEYAPITVTITGGSFASDNYVGVRLVNSPWPGLTGSYLNRYWIISQTGITNPLFNAIFQYLLADVVGTESQISCLRVEPTPTVPFSPANTNFHQLNASGVTTVGTFTGGQTAVSCTLSVTPSNQNVAASPGGSVSYNVVSNCSWTATSNQTWCMVITPTGSGNGYVSANYLANPLPTPRTATITVTVPGANPVMVTVTQAAAPCTLSVTPSNQNVAASPAGSTTFAVTTNCD
ncbi:MAG: hypothetical protein EOM90_08265, partial [Alphaproteobacteria bacterium]|nr:hypothetical protein [Alphaproteobacteria bacterium]